MTWSPELEQGKESAKIAHIVVPWTRGLGLDIGCGPWKVWPGVIGLDDMTEWQERRWRPDIVADGRTLPMFADRSLDFVFSAHFLEHVKDPEATLREWWRVIKPGGHLVLYLPHRDAYPNMGEPGSNADHYFDFTEEDILGYMAEVGRAWDCVWCERRFGGDEYSMLLAFRKTTGTGQSFSCREPKPTAPRVVVVRYGAIGDILMASSVIAGLKRQGYHVTVNTTETGAAILRHDPNVDAFWLQDRDQVPEPVLQIYWSNLESLFDRGINLSESVEGSLIAVPGRREHALPKAARHKRMNFNYLEFQHDLAEVPYEPVVRFYATEAERRWAENERASLGPGYVILFPLAGSSIHKLYPWTDSVVTWILDNMPDAICVFMGDDASECLETGIVQQILFNRAGVSYEASHAMTERQRAKALRKAVGDRVHLRSGRWELRHSLTFVQYHADMLVGPETGMMNAASFSPPAKVVLLSHSTEENLTRDWINTKSLYAVGCPCYPCHRMHYGRDFCPEHAPTGAAMCQALIRPEIVYEAIRDLRKRDLPEAAE